MRLIHFTDPHLSSLAGQTFGSVRWKRRTGYLSWTRNRQHFHLREVLAQLVAAIQGESADQFILTGDLVQIGLEEEIREAGAWLKALAPPERIFYVPGNHDVYAADSWLHVRTHWDFLLPPPPAGAPDTSRDGYPVQRNLGPVQLVGASSAVVTPPFSARGALGPGQFQRLERDLLQGRKQGQVTCLAIHHPPLPGMAKWRKALAEVQAMQGLIIRQQPAIVLCGHLHHNATVLAGETRVFCTASASSLYDASYRVFDITSHHIGGHHIRMRLMTFAQERQEFAPAEELEWQVSPET